MNVMDRRAALSSFGLGALAAASSAAGTTSGRMRPERQPAPKSDPNLTDAPSLSLVFFRSFSRSTLSDAPPTGRRIEAVVWSDRTAVFNLHRHLEPEDLRIATVEESHAQRLEAEIADATSRYDTHSSHLVPDASHAGLLLAAGRGPVELSWDERIRRGYGSNARMTEEYEQFVLQWTMFRLLLASPKIQIGRALLEERPTLEFRGFNFADAQIVNHLRAHMRP